MAQGPQQIEQPSGAAAAAGWGSDAMAEMLRRLGIPFAATTPGASFRGLHDSLVNHLGNRAPQLLICLHEEHAVAIAHGWAKVTGRAMAAILHSNVGVQHATMAVFDAWCDRVPLLLVGGTGPLDARQRRPWIDWIHTAPDQAAPLRGFLKWDDRPASVGAAVDGLLRALRIAETAPCGPTFVSLDAGLQEAALDAAPVLSEPRRHAALAPAAPRDAEIAALLGLLHAAQAPLILAGRMPRQRSAWDDRIALAEALGAAVVTDHRLPAAFPNRHALHRGMMSAPTPSTRGAVAACDLVLDLDGLDRDALLRLRPADAPAPVIVSASLDHQLLRSGAVEMQAPAPADLAIACAAEELVAALLRARLPPARHAAPRVVAPPTPRVSGVLTRADIAAALRDAADPGGIALVRTPTGWPLDEWPIDDPLSYLGGDGGAGLGSGPGLVVGAALALLGTSRRAVAVLGDGDFLMGASALWTAAHYRIPLLIVVADNRCYGNDVAHQEAVARRRQRDVGNARIGLSLDDPPVDIPGLARAFGAVAPPPATGPASLRAALAEAFAALDDGRVAVVDALIEVPAPG